MTYDFLSLARKAADAAAVALLAERPRVMAEGPRATKSSKTDPVTNADFTKLLAAALHRPALFPAPAFALRLLLGEMADALLLSSQRVQPAQLQKLNFQFAHPDLAAALATIMQT